MATVIIHNNTITQTLGMKRELSSEPTLSIVTEFMSLNKTPIGNRFTRRHVKTTSIIPLWIFMFVFIVLPPLWKSKSTRKNAEEEMRSDQWTVSLLWGTPLSKTPGWEGIAPGHNYIWERFVAQIK